MDRDLAKRLFDFAIRVIKYCRTLRKSTENSIIINQLIKADTSSGANYEECQSASSRADFRNKMCICLKEMRESNFWLRIIQNIQDVTPELNYLINESNELKKILATITKKVSD
ncbi:MAG: four helix bundle protein [Bacteroidota bacterium]